MLVEEKLAHPQILQGRVAKLLQSRHVDPGVSANPDQRGSKPDGSFLHCGARRLGKVGVDALWHLVYGVDQTENGDQGAKKNIEGETWTNHYLQICSSNQEIGLSSETNTVCVSMSEVWKQFWQVMSELSRSLLEHLLLFCPYLLFVIFSLQTLCFSKQKCINCDKTDFPRKQI